MISFPVRTFLFIFYSLWVHLYSFSLLCIPFHFLSVFLCISLYSFSLLCIPFHFSVFLCISLYSFSLLCIPFHFSVFLCISLCFSVFLYSTSLQLLGRSDLKAFADFFGGIFESEERSGVFMSLSFLLHVGTHCPLSGLNEKVYKSVI